MNAHTRVLLREAKYDCQGVSDEETVNYFRQRWREKEQKEEEKRN